MMTRPRTSNGRWAKVSVCEKSDLSETGQKTTDDKPEKVDKLAQRHAAAAVKALVAVMEDESASPAARISAAGTLLQWGFGKAGPATKSKLPEDQAGRKADYVIRLSWGAREPAGTEADTD